MNIFKKLILFGMLFLVCLIPHDSFVQAKDSKKKTVKKTTGETQTVSRIKVTYIELGHGKCIPCKMMQPIVKEIEEEYKGQVKVIDCDVYTEEGSFYAEKYRIRVIPTQVFLDENGKEYFRHEGFFPKEELIEVLKEKGVK